MDSDLISDFIPDFFNDNLRSKGTGRKYNFKM